MRRHRTTRRPRRPRKRRARLRRMREPAWHPRVVARDGQMPCGRTWRPTTRGRTSPPCSTARSRARALLRWDWGGERQRAVSERDRADVSSARADASEDRRTVSKRAKKRALRKGSDGCDGGWARTLGSARGGRATAARHDSRVGVGGDGEHGSLVSMWTPNASAIVVTPCQKSITLNPTPASSANRRRDGDRDG